MYWVGKVTRILIENHQVTRNYCHKNTADAVIPKIVLQASFQFAKQGWQYQKQIQRDAWTTHAVCSGTPMLGFLFVCLADLSCHNQTSEF